MAGPVADWFYREENRAGLHLSSIVVAEIASGAKKLRRMGAQRRAAQVRKWLDSLIDRFGERILAVDIEVAQVAGEMDDTAVARGRHPGLADILIAATAKAHGLVVLTKNIRHFETLDAPYLDPFAGKLPRN